MRQFFRVGSIDYEEVNNDIGRFVLGPLGGVVEREPHFCYFTLQGGVLVLHTKSRGKVGGGKRGKIWGFSHASRARLIRFLNTIESEASVFVTLTYPGEFDNAYSKLHLKRFANWFRTLHRYPARGMENTDHRPRVHPHRQRRRTHVWSLRPLFSPCRLRF